MAISTTGLAAHRKLFITITSMTVTMFLNKAGLNATELLGSLGGTTFQELVGGAVDLLIIGGIPTVLMWAQPNDEDKSIFRYWKAVLVGSVGIVAAIGAIVVLV